MTFKSWALLGAALLLTAPVYATAVTTTTYYGGVEDYSGLDYDYNDVVYSLSGHGLTLHTATGKWYSEPALGTSQTPFWNRSSLDGPNYNVGYCIYGGGSCGAGLAPSAQYLATSATASNGAAGDVYFTASGPVTMDIKYQVTADVDVMSWYSLSNPNQLNQLNPNANSGVFTFDPNGSFGLVLRNAQGNTFYSQSNYGTSDSMSHFAFFGTPAAADAPEPGELGLLSGGLIGLGLLVRRRTRKS